MLVLCVITKRNSFGLLLVKCLWEASFTYVTAYCDNNVTKLKCSQFTEPISVEFFFRKFLHVPLTVNKLNILALRYGH